MVAPKRRSAHLYKLPKRGSPMPLYLESWCGMDSIVDPLVMTLVRRHDGRIPSGLQNCKRCYLLEKRHHGLKDELKRLLARVEKIREKLLADDASS
jgi:hypothetical protein